MARISKIKPYLVKRMLGEYLAGKSLKHIMNKWGLTYTQITDIAYKNNWREKKEDYINLQKKQLTIDFVNKVDELKKEVTQKQFNDFNAIRDIVTQKIQLANTLQEKINKLATKLIDMPEELNWTEKRAIINSYRYLLAQETDNIVGLTGSLDLVYKNIRTAVDLPKEYTQTNVTAKILGIQVSEEKLSEIMNNYGLKAPNTI